MSGHLYSQDPEASPVSPGNPSFFPSVFFPEVATLKDLELAVSALLRSKSPGAGLQSLSVPPPVLPAPPVPPVPPGSLGSVGLSKAFDLLGFVGSVPAPFFFGRDFPAFLFHGFEGPFGSAGSSIPPEFLFGLFLLAGFSAKTFLRPDSEWAVISEWVARLDSLTSSGFPDFPPPLDPVFVWESGFSDRELCGFLERLLTLASSILLGSTGMASGDFFDPGFLDVSEGPSGPVHSSDDFGLFSPRGSGHLPQAAKVVVVVPSAGRGAFLTRFLREFVRRSAIDSGCDPELARLAGMIQVLPLPVPLFVQDPFLDLLAMPDALRILGHERFQPGFSGDPAGFPPRAGFPHPALLPHWGWSLLAYSRWASSLFSPPGFLVPGSGNLVTRDLAFHALASILGPLGWDDPRFSFEDLVLVEQSRDFDRLVTVWAEWLFTSFCGGSSPGFSSLGFSSPGFHPAVSSSGDLSFKLFLRILAGASAGFFP